MINIQTFTYNEDLNNIIDIKFKSEKPDLIVAIGGDGTFISAIRKLHNLEVPFYGLANGTLNFLMNYHKYDNINDLLENISVNYSKNNIDIIETPILNYYINNVKIGVAVNEVVYGYSIIKYPKTNVVFKKTNGFLFDEDINTSMICISSPIGSTGLSKNIKAKINPLEYPLLNINTIASNIEIHETIFDEEVLITNCSNVNIEILSDNILNEVSLKQNDVLKVNFGKKIRICYDNYEKFKIKRQLI